MGALIFVSILFIVLAIMAYRIQISNRPPMLCIRCHHVGSPVKKLRGSIVIEMVLWLCLLIPGILYSHWRGTGKNKICKACGSDDLIPTASPRAQQIIKSMNTPTIDFNEVERHYNDMKNPGR